MGTFNQLFNTKASIRKSLIIYLGSGMLVASLIMTVIISNTVKRVNTEQISTGILALTEKKADIVEKEMKEYVYSLESMASILSASWSIPEKRRRSATSMSLYSLIKHSSIKSAWACWQPGAFDRRDQEFADPEYNYDGSFRIRYVRSDTGRVRTDEMDSFDNNWIEEAMKTTETRITDPQTIEIEGNPVITATAYTRMLNYNYETVGIAGVDIILSSLEHLLDGKTIYNGTEIEFISSDGTIILANNGKKTGDKSLLFRDTSLANYFDGEQSAMFSYDKEGKDELITIAKISPDRREYINWYIIARTPFNEINRTTRFTTYNIFILLMIEVLVVQIAIWILVTNIVNPLKHSAAALKNIAEGDGDLTVRLNSRVKNEIGVMCDSFNKTMEKISTSVSDVKQESRLMKDIGNSLNESMDNANNAVQGIMDGISIVQRNMIEQNQGVQNTRDVVTQIVDNIRILSENIDEQSASVTESSSSIEEMTANIGSVSQILQRNRESIENLEKSSEEGMTLVNTTVNQTLEIQEQSKTLIEAAAVIKNISSQTNLLAMNAAIEAAHAGASGQGFAVVAGEIRKLAEQSGSQGSRIQQALKDVRQSINNVSESSRTMQNQFTSILSMTRTVSEQERVIDEAMRQQTEGGEQILQAIKQINAITAEVKTNSEAMYESSKKVTEEIQKLAETTVTVNQSMDTMTQKTAEISISTEKAMSDVARNLDSIEKLNISMNKFKVDKE